MPDQKQIVSQYCRYVGEVRTGKNIKQMVGRALQFATSHPRGPVYLTGAREVMEEEMTRPSAFFPEYWRPVEPGPLPEDGVERIANALALAEKPLIITGYSGRDPRAVDALLRLANIVKGLRVLDTGCCDMCFPADHRSSLGMRYGVDPCIEVADVILVLHCDVPWIPTQCRPQDSATIFHIDVDPLKRLMPLFYINARQRYEADAFLSLNRIAEYLSASVRLKPVFASVDRNNRWEALLRDHQRRVASQDARAVVRQGNTLSPEYVVDTIRKVVPRDTVFVVEAVTNSLIVADHVRPTMTGQWINCGGGGLGWSGGAALGVKLAIDRGECRNKRSNSGRMVVQIVGDGSFMFGMPSSVYWMSSRYEIPVLTVVLNNKGMLLLLGSLGDDDTC